MPVIDHETAQPSMTIHAKLAADRASVDKEQRQTFQHDIAFLSSQTPQEFRDLGAVTSTTRNYIFSLSIATTATAYRIFSEGSADLTEALKMGRDLASKTGLAFDARVHERQLKEIKRLSWSQYSKEQFETKIEGYIAKEIARIDVEQKRNAQKPGREKRKFGLESIKEVVEMAEAVGWTFGSGA